MDGLVLEAEGTTTIRATHNVLSCGRKTSGAPPTLRLPAWGYPHGAFVGHWVIHRGHVVHSFYFRGSIIFYNA